jgi:hypothetical protein
VLFRSAESLYTPDPDHPDRQAVAPGFALSVRDTLLPLAQQAPFPVLLVHGDHHQYKTDQPFRTPQGAPIANLWRLEVFGEPRLHAVRVEVRARGAQPPFGFEPIWNPLSVDPRLREKLPREPSSSH